MSDELLSDVLDKERDSETPGLRMGMELTLLLVRNGMSQNLSNGKPWPKTA
jgi:hypothetical protein